MTSTVEYLTAKRVVDDRALNRRVWDRFVAELADGVCEADEPVRIVDVGAGVGSMIARLAAWDGLPAHVSYRGVDLDEDAVAAGRDRLPGWLEAAGYDVSGRSDAIRARRDAGGRESAEQRLDVTLEVGDAFSITDDADAVIAAAFVDLVALEPALARFRELLCENGILYAPLTFDGATGFAPAHSLDDRIERLYHRHMDEIRDQPGSSRAGRKLLAACPDAGYDVLEVGGSDWLVGAGDAGDRERTVARYLLETIDGALADYPDDVLGPATRARWLETRTEQLENDELVVVAHHLDVLARTR